MSLTPFSEYNFRVNVDKALEKVKRILDNTRNPQYPADVHHEYTDKYVLSDFLANSAIASFLNSLEYVGLTGKAWEQLKEWSKTRNVTLRLKAEEECKFLRKATREVESDTKHVTKGIIGKVESYSVTKITEWFWQYTVKWELIAFAGVESDKAVVLQSHNGSVELKATTETQPKPATLMRPVLDVNITWLLKHTDDTKTPRFAIDRTSKKCRTPRRNTEVSDALSFFSTFFRWVESVERYFVSAIFPEQTNHGLNTSALSAEGVFVPVLPLFEGSSSSSSSSSSTSSSDKIPPVFMNSFLAEQTRSLGEKRTEIAKMFPSSDKLVTGTEAQLIVTLLHLNRVCMAYSEGVDYIEDMLHKQLVAAIGKVVTPVDFTNYLTFHNRKIFNPQYRPGLFSYAIRRPEHYPEGVLSIEAQLDDGAVSNPITTIVAESVATTPMHFALSAATKVAFYGERYVHGYVSHQFAGYSGTRLSLYARARQFSSFILLVGRIVSADLFDAKYATIIQNKDELKIPLLLETIPTPKEFKDAIASLSPEQQRFCKAFRSMQLESTLFGVAIIQIKPQLEKLLKLPDDSLTKEIKLSQELLNLFMKYQIPSDLVSYDGREDQETEFKTGRVKEYVARMQAMLTESKKEELEEAQQQQQFRQAQLPVPPPPMIYPSPVAAYAAPISPSSSAVPMGGMLSLSRSSSINASAPSPRRMVAPSAAPGGAPPMRAMAPPSMSAPPPPPAASGPPPPPPAAAPAPPPPATGGPPAPTPSLPTVPKPPQAKQEDSVVSSSVGGAVDYTKIPNELERKFEEFDENNALRPTIINPGKTWTKKFYKSLLSEVESQTLDTEEQVKERNKAFDLLDALTKSGALSIDNASLHVVIASTHCFDKNIIETIVQDNVNPIEKVENSSLIIASTIHRTTPAALISPEHIDRIRDTSSRLLIGANSDVKTITGSSNSN